MDEQAHTIRKINKKKGAHENRRNRREKKSPSNYYYDRSNWGNGRKSRRIENSSLWCIFCVKCALYDRLTGILICYCRNTPSTNNNNNNILLFPFSLSLSFPSLSNIPIQSSAGACKYTTTYFWRFRLIQPEGESISFLFCAELFGCRRAIFRSIVVYYVAISVVVAVFAHTHTNWCCCRTIFEVARCFYCCVYIYIYKWMNELRLCVNIIRSHITMKDIRIWVEYYMV